MRKFAVLASILTAAVITANCANSGSVVSPSGADASASAALDAKRSGGGGKPSGGGTTGGGSGTINWVMVTDKNGDSAPSFNDVITFNVSTTATTMPWVTLKCYQGSTLVLQTSNGIFPTSITQNFTLGPSPLWQSGAASCTATLENWDGYPKSITTLGSTSISVN